MPKSQDDFRLTKRPPAEAYDEELLRLAQRLGGYRDPEQLMCALPAELFDVVRANSLLLSFCNGPEATSWLAIDSKKDAIASTPKGLDAQNSLQTWIMEERRKPFVLSSLKENSPFPDL